MPEAFLKRGNADLNSPGAVVWEGVLEALEQELRLATCRVIIVEGLLLLADHPGAEAIRGLCDTFIVLDLDVDATPKADGDSEAKSRQLWMRKFTRTHLGKKSYKDRGCSEEAYKVYWDTYVNPGGLNMD